MPKDVDIQPGQAFHLPAAQEKNIGALMKILGKKEATEALKEIGKMEASTWMQVRDTVSDLKDFVAMGGMGTVYTNLIDSIKLQLDQAMSPITNQLNSIVTDVLGPIYSELQALATDLAEFVSEGPTGAFWGSLVGSIWGELGQLIGGLLGAAIEHGLNYWWDNMVPGGSNAGANDEWEWVLMGGIWMLRKKTPSDYDPGPGQTPEEYIEYRERDF